MTTLIKYFLLIVIIDFYCNLKILAQEQIKCQNIPLFMINPNSIGKDNNTPRTNPKAPLVDCKIVNGNIICFQDIGSQVSPDISIPMFNQYQYDERASSPSICIDPINKKEIFTAATVFLEPYANGIDQEFSFNYGLQGSWTGGVNFTGIEGLAFFNPAVAIVNNGNSTIRYTGNNMMFWYDIQTPIGPVEMHALGQGISYSLDDGISWVNKLIAIPLKYDNEGKAMYFLIRNHLAVDNNEKSDFYGSVYSAWTPSTNYWISYSTFNVPDWGKIDFKFASHGNDWSPPDDPVHIISDASPIAPEGTIFNCGANIQIGPNGEIYAVWAMYHNEPEINPDEDGAPPYGSEFALGFTKSLDGGQSFDPAWKIIDNIKGVNKNNNFFKNHGYYPISFPVMCVDYSVVHTGRIYVAWSNLGTPGINSGSYANIYVIHSDDSGLTWTSPVNITSLERPEYIEQKYSVYPWISCDNETGKVCVIYYDDRNFGIFPEVFDSRFDTYVSMSKDGGKTWVESHTPVISVASEFEFGGINDFTFCTIPDPDVINYFSDFNGIAVKDGLAYPVWTSNAASESSSENQSFTTVSPFYIWNCIPSVDLFSSNSLQVEEVKKFECQNYITAQDFIVPAGTFGFFDAGYEISLREGFHAQSDCYFHAYIDGCEPFIDTDTSYEDFSSSSYSSDTIENLNLKHYLETKLIKIYPNPTNGNFTVDLGPLTRKDVSLILTNALNESILNLTPPDQAIIKVCLENYPKGIYFLKILTNNCNYIKKIIYQ